MIANLARFSRQLFAITPTTQVLSATSIDPLFLVYRVQVLSIPYYDDFKFSCVCHVVSRLLESLHKATLSAQNGCWCDALGYPDQTHPWVETQSSIGSHPTLGVALHKLSIVFVNL
ncbi:hypothetical protein DFH08DRAFT_800374 [Mycena albidolilacea]|uniref:Uncharacterized protein n=1 Tax=Mycena albidolilacea TaxID=1033008 RepID=A0AAD7AJX6_9AGAR|nr:hypothetical protein DFH08DRAFT_800374 [Mycena albidolilacea]